MYRTFALPAGKRRALALAVLTAFCLEAVPHAAPAATTHVVDTCADDPNQAGSLRALVGSATSGDTIDLSGPLGSHGGPVDTMLPAPGSPVLRAGNNSNGLSFDQRGGKRYSRTTGGHTGIGAVQSDDLLGAGFE